MGAASKPTRALPVDYVEISAGKDVGAGADHAACYTRALLKSCLQLAGYKTKIAHKASKLVFQRLGTQCIQVSDAESSPAQRRSIVLERRDFEHHITSAVRSLTDKSTGEGDVQIACSIREQRSCVIIMLAGTSGTGKSTLASLLAAKMGITTVVSTDSIRHMLRSFTSEEQDPILWASTYQAGELIPQLPASPTAASNPRTDAKIRAVKGYKAQCESVLERVGALVAVCEARQESCVVEGVHLSINAVIRIMARHPSVLPFLVHISNENKHRERFAVRAKYMTLDPEVNRYVKHFRQIRVIQNYLVERGERHFVPRVDNTNVDRSVAAIHATVLSCLRRRQRGEEILDRVSKTATPLAEDYELCLRDAWSSKGMLQIIRSRKSGAGEPPAPANNGHLRREEAAAGQDRNAATVGSSPASSTPERRKGCPVLEFSDAAAVTMVGRDASSSGDAEDSAAEHRVEAASVAETEMEEHEDDEHSEAISARSSGTALKRVSPQSQ